MMMMIAILIAAIVVALVVFSLLCYKKAPPTQAIVVTGFGLSRPKVVCGRGVFVLPVVQRADRLNMRLLKIDVKTPETGVKTKEGVSLWLDSVVTVQVYSENSTVSDEEVRNAGYDDIKKYINTRQQAAISNFLGMDEAHINEKINDVLQGNLREIVTEMTVDQILTNRKQMAVSVVENARPDLAKMGLEVVTFNVQDVKDAVDAMGHNHGVIEAIGVEQEELVKKRASIAKAEAERDVSCAKAAAAMAANEKEIEAQTAIAQRNNELELAKSKLKAEADKAAADAHAAGMIQTNLRAKEVKESEADAEIARQKEDGRPGRPGGRGAAAQAGCRGPQAGRRRAVPPPERGRSPEVRGRACRRGRQVCQAAGGRRHRAGRQRRGRGHPPEGPGRSRSDEAESRSLQAVQRRRRGRDDDQRCCLKSPRAWPSPFQHRQGVHHWRRCVRCVGRVRQRARADGPDHGGHEGSHRH